MLLKSVVIFIPRKVSVSSPLAKKVCGPADPGAIVQLSISNVVPGTSAAAPGRVEAERGLPIAPGLHSVGGAVELDPAPETAGATHVRAQHRVVAVERQPDLPHVVVGTTA